MIRWKAKTKFPNNRLFIEQDLNLEVQELVKKLEELPYEEDDDFSNEV
ncbi:15328_t:CDS:2 [Funneliformis mosseae]|uniref:15328_t:CDS:1 n=1 Tax=Funneliformis mosseae TaxID=27381 RepID=A0A9N8ZSF0_FUNMO|nr:15328_t:CDS:2 [Funneliformis mosseae]